MQKLDQRHHRNLYWYIFFFLSAFQAFPNAKIKFLEDEQWYKNICSNSVLYPSTFNWWINRGLDLGCVS